MSLDAIAIAVAVHTAHAPQIDGRIDEVAWLMAPAQSAFTQKFPDEGSPPAEGTSFRVLFDETSVYIGVECIQQTAPIVARLARRDRVTEADRVTVAFDTHGDGRTAYELTVNAAGVQSDTLRFNDTDSDPDWDETWDARVAETPRGWSAELRIPLRILRFREGAEHEWGLQVRRYVSRRQETDEWAFIPRARAGEVSRYGRLTGVDVRGTPADIELRPFVLGRFERRDAGSGAATRSQRFGGSAGLDAKWHPRRDLALDVAVLPDFAQVEADQLVLNLTNEEIQLPEKRPFFFEGRDLFTMPMQLLYTRRIGRITPDDPVLASGESLAEPLRAATLLGATKLSGRLSDRASIGILSALTAKNDAVVNEATGERATRALEPRTFFQATRLKYELAGNAHLGAFAGSVVRAERRDEARCDGGRCTHDAYVGAVDGRWRSADGDWTATSQLTGSAIHDGPPRVQFDGTSIASGDLGFGNVTRVAKEGGVPWVGEAVYSMGSRRLDFNDLGYMSRSNVHSVSLTLERRTLAPWRDTLETHTRLEVYGRTNLDGLVLAHGYQVNTEWRWNNFWSAFVEVHYRGRRFDDREVGDGTALERRELVGLEVELKTDPRRAVSFELTTQSQRIFTGVAMKASATAYLRVVPQLEISLGPEWVHAAGEPRFVAKTSRSLLFAALRAEELSTTLRASWTFTPRLSLQTYAQLFLASGHYDEFGTVPITWSGRGRVVHRDELRPAARPEGNPDFENAALNANVVLRWEYALGSTIYFVYTRMQSPTIELGPTETGQLDANRLGKAPATDTILLKLTHFFG